MSHLLTDRQKKIIQTLIQEFVKGAEPIGSSKLVEKYRFQFSPATMRNEMATLAEKGFLQKDHVSSGRSPTPLAFRYYIKNLMQEEALPVVNEVALKQRLWDNRHDMDLLLREVSYALSEELKNLSLVITHDGRIYKAGVAHILRHPEFYDIDVTRTVLYLLDQYETLNNMLTQLSQDADFGILLGDELGLPTLKNCGMVISRVDLPQGGMGHLTVLGPYRLNYQKVIPTVKYLQKLLNELNRTW